MTQDQQVAYWRRNLVGIAGVLAAWAAVSFGAGIAFADWLDGFKVAGFPVGFWFANQGSVIAFVVLTFAYVSFMNRLDKKYGVYEP